MKKTAYIFCLLLAFTLICPAFRKGEVVFGENEGVKVPVLMYHSILPNSISRYAFAINLSSFIADLNFLQTEGYTTILPRDLVNFVNGKKELPEKPIILTFDDGFYNNLSLAADELNKRNMKAAFAVVGKYIEKYAYENNKWGYLSYEDLLDLQNMGHEICSHSYDMHERYPRHGMLPKYGEDEGTYEYLVKNDVKKLNNKLEENGIFVPCALAYPFGHKSKKTDRYLQECGIAVTFSCRELVSTVTKDPDSLLSLGRFNRDKKSAREILRNI